VEEPRLVPFEPPVPSHTNGNGSGSRRRRRRRALGGVSFGTLIGGLLATSLVPQLQWLNLSRIGWWGRPVGCAIAAGMLVGAYRREDARAAVSGGAIAGLLGLWGVYLLIRASVPVLFVERSFARVLVTDLARLGIYGAPAGAAGAALTWWLISSRSRPGSPPPSR
jgi:hypothetical protein